MRRRVRIGEAITPCFPGTRVHGLLVAILVVPSPPGGCCSSTRPAWLRHSPVGDAIGRAGGSGKHQRRPRYHAGLAAMLGVRRRSQPSAGTGRRKTSRDPPRLPSRFMAGRRRDVVRELGQSLDIHHRHGHQAGAGGHPPTRWPRLPPMRQRSRYPARKRSRASRVSSRLHGAHRATATRPI